MLKGPIRSSPLVNLSSSRGRNSSPFKTPYHKRVSEKLYEGIRDSPSVPGSLEPVQSIKSGRGSHKCRLHSSLKQSPPTTHTPLSLLSPPKTSAQQVCLTLAFSLRDKFAGSFIAFGKRLSVDKLEHESRKARTFPRSIVRKRRSIFVLQWVKSFLEVLFRIGGVREEKVFSQENCSSKLFSSQEETHGKNNPLQDKGAGTKQKGVVEHKKTTQCTRKGDMQKNAGR